MACTVVVSNLPYHTTADDLRELFGRFGVVTVVKVVPVLEAHRPRSLGYVTMGDEADAQRATRELDDQVFNGRTLRVGEAPSRSQRRRSDSHGGCPEDQGALSVG